MNRTHALIALLIAAALTLAGCSSTPPTPLQQAAALLAKAGATANGPAYIVAPVDTQSECDTGSDEADGTIASPATYVNACVFPGNAQLQSDLDAGQYAAGAGIVEVGEAELVFIVAEAGITGAPPAALVRSVAAKTGGAVYGTP